MLGLYIHIPFCKKKCNYCDFISFENSEHIIDNYLKFINKEIKLVNINDYKPDTIYVGGGTPSILTEQQIGTLFKIIYSNFNCGNIQEISYECNPESLTETKLRILKDFNVNRLSIGLQSFNNKYLKILGRLHTTDKFTESFYQARNIGFDNINVDLIYGIPGQTLADWKSELKKIVNISPEHISVYPLTIEKGTKFYKNGIKINDDLQADMYEYAINYLVKKGYEHYEISNLGKIRCKHNQIYWKNEPYLGIGLNAVSYIDGIRRKNTDNINEYFAILEKNELPIIESEKLDSEKSSSERIILGLRLIEGIELMPDENKFITKFEQLKQMGLIECINSRNRWKLTKRGILLSNYVFSQLI